MKTENDKAWEAFFEGENINPNDAAVHGVRVTARAMKKYREPRLMAKFDHQINLPKIFADNKLSILPTSRGSYFIGRFDGYCRMEASSNLSLCNMSLPEHLQSLDANHITSEAIAIHCAAAAGIVADFLGDENVYATVCGRMGSGHFDFRAGNTKPSASHAICVKNAQMEIDAAYEGIHSLAIFEAKINISDDTDFLIRQLYYPFRTWSDRLKKPVRPVFLIYANGIYTLREYAFRDPLVYNSIEMLRQERYSLEDTNIEIQEIEETIRQAVVQPAPQGVPFPQANTFDRIINLCEILKTRILTSDDIAQEYDFTRRQSDYYANAAMYLGLVCDWKNKSKKTYELTGKGRKIMQMRYKQRQLALCECICSRDVFNALAHQYFQTGKLPEQKDIALAIQAVDRNLAPATLKRRADTAASWLGWIARLRTIR